MLDATAPLRWLRFASAILGFAVLLPVIGHATWHTYREAIDASAWPRNEPAQSGEMTVRLRENKQLKYGNARDD